jgi:hypothetical protein
MRHGWHRGWSRGLVLAGLAGLAGTLGGASAGAAAVAADGSDVGGVAGWAFGGIGETVFEHTRAALRDPHFGMRFYMADKVPGTLSPVSDPSAPDANTRAAAAGGDHLFWDVAFGERAPVVGWYDVHPERSIRHARGFQLNLDAAAFLLLDFGAQSSAVINTDYRLGISGDLRPWRDGWDRVSLSLGFFHQSTHLGDEYVLSAPTIQDSGVPSANPSLPYRANPSYLGLPLTVSVDLGGTGEPVSARVYAGGAVYFDSGIPAATHPDGRVGLELRYAEPEPVAAAPEAAAPEAPTSAPDASQPTKYLSDFLTSAKQLGLGHARLPGEQSTPTPGADRRGRTLRRGARAYVLAYEALVQHKYAHDPGFPGQPVFRLDGGAWVTHHAVAMLVFNLDTLRSTSNALALSLELIDGRNQHGQLIEYDSVRTVAAAISYYW